MFVNKVYDTGEKKKKFGMVSDSEVFFLHKLLEISRTILQRLTEDVDQQYYLEASNKVNKEIKKAKSAVSLWYNCGDD